MNVKQKIKSPKKFFKYIFIIGVIITSYLVFRTNKNYVINEETSKEKVLSYLKAKYQQDFEVNKLVKYLKGGKPLFNFDGPTDTTGQYTYDFEIVSTKDNIIFNVHYLNNNGIDVFLDSYTQIEKINQISDEILNHISSNIKNTNLNGNLYIKEETEYFYFNHFTYSYNIDIDERINDIITYEYVDNIENTRKYIFEKIIDRVKNKQSQKNEYFYFYENNDFYMTFFINLHYKDHKNIALNCDNSAIRDEGSIVGGYEIYTYLREGLGIY